MRTVVRLVAALLVIAPLVYFTVIGVEASHQLVNQHTRSADCRTPGHVGVAYEPINYDGASDEPLLAAPDPTECATFAAPAGDGLVTVDGVSLAGWYLPSRAPIGDDGPTVILAHGWTGNKSGQIDEALIFLERTNVVMFDFRNHGQSEAAPTTQGIHEQRDLAAVVDWVVREKGAETIVLWGQSMGGHTAVNVAADDERVDALILDVTHPTLRIPMANRLEAKGYPLGGLGAWATVLGAWVRTGVNVVSDDPIDAVTELGDRPVLMIAAESDDTIPVAEIRAMADHASAAGVDARFAVCEGAEHHLVVNTCPDDYARWMHEMLDAIGVAE